MVKVIASILTVVRAVRRARRPGRAISATVGSVVGQRLHMTASTWARWSGAGGRGHHSIFNAPIAGVFFVLEILRDFSVKAFAPIVVASVFSRDDAGGLGREPRDLRHAGRSAQVHILDS